MRRIIINEKTKETRCAVLEEEQLVEIHQSYSSEDEIIGNIFAGRVKKVLPGMQAAFVDIGLPHNGYLHRNDLVSFQLAEASTNSSISHYVREGELLLVQVVKSGTDQKGPKLTTNIEFGGSHLVYMPYGNYKAVSKKIADEAERNRLLALTEEFCKNQEGILLRTASKGKSKKDLEEEYNSLKKKFEQVKKTAISKPQCVYEARSFVDRLLNEMSINKEDTLISDQLERVQSLKTEYPESSILYHDKKEGIFSFYKIEQEIEKLLKQIVWLKNGAYIIIEQTEAMTIIDVNTGKFSGKLSMRDTVLKTNELAAIEAAKQIRLRNLSGIILIDFIDMKQKEDRQYIEETLKKQMKQDRVQHKVLGFTELNILQITRKKVRQPVDISITEPCRLCKGTGRVPSAEAIAFKLERELWEYQFMDEEAVWIEATNDVIHLLAGENNEHLIKLEGILKFNIICSEYHTSNPSYRIKQFGDYHSIMERVRSYSKENKV
ncbi:Rne/Rng family ribonuclease [Metabacillus litoralis]|uniref:Rne/Rng family ribonuclease n=1 Tax=Metabacillus litoralis TaxID=152268 RepID=UPI0013CF2EB4|nr:Rne/Rng family ribonuclease [Metabacillus litoralis]